MITVPSRFSTAYKHGLRREFLNKDIVTKIDSVNNFCSIRFDVSLENICWHNRIPEAIHARFVAWYIARGVFGVSYPVLGKFYDRDHTTIINGCQIIKNDPKIQDHISDFKEGYTHVRPDNSNNKF